LPNQATASATRSRFGHAAWRSSSADSTSETACATWRFSGVNCPGPTTTNPCPTSPDAYKARKILVYNEAKTELLHTVDIDSQGAYFIDLAPAKYTVDLRGAGIDRTGDLPQTVDIHANAVVTLNVNIDTGLR
jgi:hypothetical protein